MPNVPEMKLKVSPARASETGLRARRAFNGIWGGAQTGSSRLRRFDTGTRLQPHLDESALSHRLLANQDELRPGRGGQLGVSELSGALVILVVRENQVDFITSWYTHTPICDTQGCKEKGVVRV